MSNPEAYREGTLELTNLISRSYYPETYGPLPAVGLNGVTAREAKISALMTDPAAYFEAAWSVQQKRVAELAIQNS